MPAIQSITDAQLIEAIDCARHRVVMIAPGIWQPLAKSISAAWQRLGPDRVTAIVDIDPEICRMGYGSLEGLQILQKAASGAGEALGAEPGIRICVVIVDEQTFVFSPTPRLLEAPPEATPESGSTQAKANGIILNAPPQMLEAELGGGPDGILERTLGMKTLDEAKLEKVTKDLEKNPAKNFDLARSVNVYNAKIRFVEFRVGGYRVSQHTVNLPKHLVSIARKNKDLARKIASAVKLLDSEDPLVGGEDDDIMTEGIYGPKNVSQSTVEAVRNAIEEKFLRPVKGIGKVIRREKIEEFMKEVSSLEMTLGAFAAVMKGVLSDLFRKTANEIADAILPDVLDQLPEKWQKQLGPTPNPEHVRFRIIDDLIQSFGEPERRCHGLNASVVFKDVTYDMLKDPDFRAEIHGHFPDLPLMEEYTAAKERPSYPPT